MNIYSWIMLIISSNIVAFIALNYFAYKSNSSDKWLQAMRSNAMKITVFVFAVPLSVVFAIFYLKGVLDRR